MYTDLFHMYPTDGKINEIRDNYPFGETNGSSTKNSMNNFSKLGSCTYSGYTGTVFEPNDEYKGDFARTYFYMVTCYEEKLSDWYKNNADSRPTLDGKTYPGLSSWQLSMLMKWAKNDPVSEKETNRNNALSGHMKQGHQVKQQGQSVNDETAQGGKKAVNNALISKSDFTDLFYSLSKKRLISPDKYEAMKLYNQLLQDGWSLRGKAVESLVQLENILPLLLPYSDDDSDDDVGEENRANGYLFEALLATSPKNASLSDVLNIHADISDTIEFNYATKTYMWTYGDHVYSINRIKELCAQVWADWSEDNAEGDSS